MFRPESRRGTEDVISLGAGVSGLLLNRLFCTGVGVSFKFGTALGVSSGSLVTLRGVCSVSMTGGVDTVSIVFALGFRPRLAGTIACDGGGGGGGVIGRGGCVTVVIE